MTELVPLTIRRGALRFTGETYERFFNSLDNVVLLRDGDDLLVFPVRHRAAGGYVIKIRTGAGDRAVAAADFFRDNGIEDSVEMVVSAEWDDERSALVARQVFCCQLSLQTEM